jgi:hypothetical protein
VQREQLSALLSALSNRTVANLEYIGTIAQNICYHPAYHKESILVFYLDAHAQMLEYL